MMHQCLLSARQLQPIKHESDCKNVFLNNFLNFFIYFETGK